MRSVPSAKPARRKVPPKAMADAKPKDRRRTSQRHRWAKSGRDELGHRIARDVGDQDDPPWRAPERRRGAGRARCVGAKFRAVMRRRAGPRPRRAWPGAGWRSGPSRAISERWATIWSTAARSGPGRLREQGQRADEHVCAGCGPRPAAASPGPAGWRHPGGPSGPVGNAQNGLGQAQPDPRPPPAPDRPGRSRRGRRWRRPARARRRSRPVATRAIR